MPDLTGLIETWGYVLVVAGYLVSVGRLRWPPLLAVGIASAVIGDNIGYCIGRRFGRAGLTRIAPRLGIERLARAERFVAR